MRAFLLIKVPAKVSNPVAVGTAEPWSQHIDAVGQLSANVAALEYPQVALNLGISPTAESVQRGIDALRSCAHPEVRAVLRTTEFHFLCITDRQPRAAEILVSELARLRGLPRMQATKSYCGLMRHLTQPEAARICCEVFPFRVPAVFKALVAL